MDKNFPKHWVETDIQTVFYTASGGTPSTSNREYWENGNIPWINSGKLKDNIITEPSHFITKLGLDNSSAKLFPKNTVVIALTGATTGKVGLLNFECSTNQSVTGVFPSKYYSEKLLFLYLIYIRENILAQSLGSAQPHINKKIVDNIKIPLPPLNEQKRIVEKLDALLPKVKSAKARLEKIPAILKKFRQSVLAAACSGKLTEDWREEYAKRTGKELGEGKSLLDSILKIKRELQNKKLISKDKEYDVNVLELTMPLEIPSTWTWARMNDVFEILRGASPRPGMSLILLKL